MPDDFFSLTPFQKFVGLHHCNRGNCSQVTRLKGEILRFLYPCTEMTWGFHISRDFQRRVVAFRTNADCTTTMFFTMLGSCVYFWFWYITALEGKNLIIWEILCVDLWFWMQCTQFFFWMSHLRSTRSTIQPMSIHTLITLQYNNGYLQKMISHFQFKPLITQ